jgi:hypothetical protein
MNSEAKAAGRGAEEQMDAEFMRRVRTVAMIKAVVATLFFAIVLFTLGHPVSIVVSVVDLALIPVFVWLAKRHPRAATYGLVIETALFLTPRQFVQGYVNGVNWPIYIVIPLIAGYLLMQPHACVIGAILTGIIALPVMLVAALTLPPGMQRADVFTLIAFVIGLMLALARVGKAMLCSRDHEQETRKTR